VRRSVRPMPPTVPAWADRLSPPPTARSARHAWEGYKLWFSVAPSLPSPPPTAPSDPLLTGRTQLSLARRDFSDSLRRDPQSIGTFFPPLGLHDPKHSLGFTRTNTRPGTLNGRIVQSRFLTIPQPPVSPRRSPRRKVTKLSPIKLPSPRPATDKSTGLIHATAGVVKTAGLMRAADANNDGTLDLQEFRCLLRLQLRGADAQLETLAATSDATLRKWFDAFDVVSDGRSDGELSRTDMFGFALKQACIVQGVSISTLLKSFPELSRTPKVPRSALESVAHRFGFDAQTAADVFRTMDIDRSGTVTFSELETWSRGMMRIGDARDTDGTKPLDSLAALIEGAHRVQSAARESTRAANTHAFVELSARRPSVGEIHKQLGNVMPTAEDMEDATRLGRELRAAVCAVVPMQDVGASCVLIDLMQEWDTSDSGKINLHELHQAMVLQGVEGSAGAVTGLFDRMDANGNYTMGFDEFAQWLHSTDGNTDGEQTTGPKETGQTTGLKEPVPVVEAVAPPAEQAAEVEAAPAPAEPAAADAADDEAADAPEVEAGTGKNAKKNAKKREKEKAKKQAAAADAGTAGAAAADAEVEVS